MKSLFGIVLLSIVAIHSTSSSAVTLINSRPTLLFASEQEAAQAAANSYNPLSIREDREYMGTIYRSGGKFGYTVVAAKHAEDSWQFSVPRAEWQRVCAIWHTHGAPSPSNKFFSSEDTSSVRRLDVPFYLADHTGFLKIFRKGDKTLSPFAAARRNLPRRPGFAEGTLVRDEQSRPIRVLVRERRSILASGF